MADSRCDSCSVKRSSCPALVAGSKKPNVFETERREIVCLQTRKDKKDDRD